MEDTQHPASEPKPEALIQSLEVMVEKLKQRSEAEHHPFAVTEPTARVFRGNAQSVSLVPYSTDLSSGFQIGKPGV